MTDIGQGRPGSATLTLEAIERFIPAHLIQHALTVAGRHSVRLRKLPATGVVWLMIGIGLFADADLPAIWRQVMGTLARLKQVAARIKPAGKSAIAAARRKLGPRVMRLLFLAAGAPTQADSTPGLFYRGLRLLAIDGDKLALPDTPANVAAFGRPSTRRGGQVIDAGYPQMLTVRLIEVATRISLDVIIKPCHHSEYRVADALLKRAPAGALVLWDRGFYGYSLLKQAMQRGAHVLGRVASHVKFEVVAHLSDSSFLAHIYPTTKDRRHKTNPLLVRVIRYTLDDPQRVGHQQEHRLVTTLLDETVYPAQELIVLYHQRWEIEIANDEITTHQLNRPVELRSQTPAGAVQELFGILLAHNAIRRLMHESARQVNIDPRTISFMHTVRVIRETLPLMRAAAANAPQQIPWMYDMMLQHIAQGRLPPRGDRINPRVIKVKMSNFAKKRATDRGKKVRPFADGVKMLK